MKLDELTGIHADLIERNDELEDKIIDVLAMILAELRDMRRDISDMREHGLRTWQDRD